MVSGVSFKNTSPTTSNRRTKKSASRGLVVLFVLLLISVAIYAIVFLWHRDALADGESYVAQTAANDTRIQELLGSEQAHALMRVRAIDSQIYSGDTTQRILQKCEQALVPGVVFSSFEHSYDRELDVSTISIAGDADTFDIMATQIQRWEDSEDFDHVTVSSTERDEETGRVVFAATLTTPTGTIGAVRTLWDQR